ncbi:hypothetical protein Tco_1235024 [Tanacetum coccineum]
MKLRKKGNCRIMFDPEEVQQILMRWILTLFTGIRVPPHTPNIPVDKKDFDFDKILDDLFRMGADNLKQMGQDIVQDNVIQPLILTTLHTTPPNKDFVALATKPILDKLLEDKTLNVAMVDEEADSNRDLEELERLLVEDPHFTEIQVKARGVVLGLNLATGKHFKSRLVGYHAEDDDGMFLIVDVTRGSRLGAWLRNMLFLHHTEQIHESFLFHF